MPGGALKPAGARTLTLLLLLLQLLRRAIDCDEAVVGGLDPPAGGLLAGGQPACLPGSLPTSQAHRVTNRR